MNRGAFISIALIAGLYWVYKTPKAQASVGTLSARAGELYSLASSINETELGGFFNSAERSLTDVLRVWKAESNFDASAVNADDPSGAWGIGQVLATTATDYGITDPSILLDEGAGALISMKHLKWTWEELARRMGREPTNSEWIAAYNRGAAAVSNGATGSDYVARVKSQNLEG